MAGLLEGASTFLGSPGGSLVMSGLGAGMNTYKGNQAAMASQAPMSLYKGSQGQVGYLSDPRHLQGAGQAMTAHGQNQMGAEIIGNSMVNSGATLTSQQGKALDPQARQRMQQQGALTPGLMENFMKQLTPEMIANLFQLFGGQGGQQPPSEGQ